MKIKILVTGCCGFIGTELTLCLLNGGYDVIGLDNMNAKYYNTDKYINLKEIQHKYNNFKFVLDDVVTTNIIKEEHPNIIIHLANLAGVRKSSEYPMDYIRVNVEGTTNIFDQIVKYCPNTLFIYASSSSVYGEREGEFKETDEINVAKIKSIYALSKKMMEDLAEFYDNQFNIKSIGLRFFTVYGERGRFDMAPYKFLDSLNKNETIIKYGNGTSYRDYTYVGDIVDGIMKIMEHYIKYPLSLKKNQIFNLGNNNPITLNEFIDTCESVTNKKTIIIEKKMEKFDVFGTCANIDKAKKLGYYPKTTLKEGLSKMNEYYF